MNESFEAGVARPASAADAEETRQAVIDATLEIAAEGGWADVTLRALAERAEVPFAQVYGAFRTPAHVVAAVLNEAVTASLEEALPDGALSIRDRAFDAAMNVLDALKPRRAALGAMLRSYRLRPLAGAPALGAVARFARVTLERAGAGADGAGGAARIASTARLLWRVLGVFAADDEGLSKTMAELDARLRDAEGWAKRLGWARG